MKVVITDEAFSDLLEIGRTIAKDNSARAETLSMNCTTTAYAWDRCPAHFRCYRIGRTVAFAAVPTEIISSFRITDIQVEIIHILPGARDYEAILFPGA